MDTDPKKARREWNERGLQLPSHSCNKTADFSAYMQGDRELWVGEIEDPPDGYEQEKWCLHVETPEKPPVTFGLNMGDLTFLAAIAHMCLEKGIPVERWMNSAISTAKSNA
jgi:hypothetical protein